MSKRRGKRVVVGYVVSHTGKRGGPWEADMDALRAALTEARAVLSLCKTARNRSVPEYIGVRDIGRNIGYGAMMSAASAAWAEMFDGTPQEGSQHTCGPSERTVHNTIKTIDAALNRGAHVADRVAHAVAAKRTHARALPLVRYEVDAEEERLRDAVVEAAERWESAATPLYLVPSAAKELESAVRALRAHREKVGR